MPHDSQGQQLVKGDRVHVIPQQIGGTVESLFGCQVLVRQVNGELWLHHTYEVQRQRAA